MIMGAIAAPRFEAHCIPHDFAKIVSRQIA
jgi:hypothetical protein